MSFNKIALFLPSLEGGGAERVFVQLANQYAALGYSVDLVLASRRGPYLSEVSSKTNVIDLGATSVSRSLPKLVRYLRESRPQVIQSGLDHANIVAILAAFFARTRTRCVISMRSVPTAVYREDKSVRRWLMLQLMRILYPFANMIIANSQAVKTDLSESLRIPVSKLCVIYNPLNMETINRMSEAKIEHPLICPDTPPLVIAVGSLAVLKDFPTLIRAFSIVRKERDCRLVILGEGQDRHKLEVLIGELGLQRDAFLPGFISNPFPWIKRAAVFVSSSLTEGCPNSLMQALACNTAIVSTDCIGGSAEILQDGYWGKLVPVSDADAMANAILATLNSKEKASSVPRANDFTLAKIAAEYLQVLFPEESTQIADGQS